MRTPLQLLLALAALTASVATIGFSGANFSTVGTANPSNSFAAASSFCPNPGSVTLPATRDAYVYQLNSGANFGSDTTLQVSPGVLSLLVIHRSLVGFDLTTINSFCTVTAATLRLFATSAASGRTIGVFRANGTWTEAGVTYSNQPATAGAAVTGASGTGWRTWNVLTQVQAQISGTNNGFLVKDQSEGAVLSLQAQIYQSREGSTNSQDPELVLTLQ